MSSLLRFPVIVAGLATVLLAQAGVLEDFHNSVGPYTNLNYGQGGAGSWVFKGPSGLGNFIGSADLDVYYNGHMGTTGATIGVQNGVFSWSNDPGVASRYTFFYQNVNGFIDLTGTKGFALDVLSNDTAYDFIAAASDDKNGASYFIGHVGVGKNFTVNLLPALGYGSVATVPANLSNIRVLTLSPLDLVYGAHTTIDGWHSFNTPVPPTTPGPSAVFAFGLPSIVALRARRKRR